LEEKLTLYNKQKEEESNERHRVALAIKLKICPTCGSSLISQPIEVLNPPKKFLFGLIEQRIRTWGYRTICSTDSAHYEDKGFYHDDKTVFWA
jgi:hypothetical protein